MQISLFHFTEELILELELINKERTASSYRSAIKKFLTFVNAEDFFLTDINSQIICDFKDSMVASEISNSTIAYYLRTLRAIYNKAVKKDLINDLNPFDRLLQFEESKERNAIMKVLIDKLWKYKFINMPSLSFARDMFIFSYYGCGISYYDMALLTKQNIKGRTIVYNKRGVGTKITLSINSKMASIIVKYDFLNGENDLLFPIFQGERGSKNYESAMRLQNKRLKLISDKLKIYPSLSSITARNSWAIHALENGVDKSEIGFRLGLPSEKIIMKYLSSIKE